MVIRAIMGRKVGMTQTFTSNGVLLPVTVVLITPSVVVRVKTQQHDGYDAVQLGFEATTRTLPRAVAGQFQTVKQPPHRYLYEVRVQPPSSATVGTTINVQDVLTPGMRVDVTGISKGRGLTGVIKKDHQARGPKSHGSHHYRRVGSRGSIAPNRIFKGKALPGRMGHWRVTAQGLTVVQINPKRQLLLLLGAVPGRRHTRLLISATRLFRARSRPAVQLFNRQAPATV